MIDPAARPLKGKTIAVIGPGGRQKLHHYEAMRTWGARTEIICSDLDPTPTATYADGVIVIHGLYSHRDDEKNAKTILDVMNQRHLKPDGVLTLWEDCAPLAARVALALELPGVSPLAASTAKSKLETYRVLAGQWMTASCARLHVNTRECNSESDLEAAIEKIGLPAILKLEYGSSAAAVVPVYTPTEARDKRNRIIHTLRFEEDWPGIGLGFGPRIVLSELLEGTEHDVDVVLWKGERIATFVTDNGPTRHPSCAESCAVMPSTVSNSTRELLVDAAVQACLQIGLITGVFNIELINTSDGPRVIDVNGRMGGFYVRDWVLEIWKYDLLAAALLCCIGIRPEPSASESRKYIAGAMLLPSIHGAWLSDPNNQRRLRSVASARGAILVQFEEDIHNHELVDEPWGNLAIGNQTSSSAVASLVELWDILGLQNCDPDIVHLLSTLAR